MELIGSAGFANVHSTIESNTDSNDVNANQLEQHHHHHHNGKAASNSDNSSTFQLISPSTIQSLDPSLPISYSNSNDDLTGHTNSQIVSTVSDIISATNNVVTCVNPNPNEVNSNNDWWTPFATLNPTIADQSLPSYDMIYTADNNGSNLITSSIILGGAALSVASELINNNNNKTSHFTKSLSNKVSSSLSSCTVSSSSSSSSSPTISTVHTSNQCKTLKHESSPFDAHSTIQPWIDCKTDLEEATFELDHLDNL